MKEELRDFRTSENNDGETQHGNVISVAFKSYNSEEINCPFITNV